MRIPVRTKELNKRVGPGGGLLRRFRDSSLAPLTQCGLRTPKYVHGLPATFDSVSAVQAQ